MCGETCDWERVKCVFVVFLLKDVNASHWERKRERNVWRGKGKKCSSTNEWKDKKPGDVFIVSWFFHLKS